MPRRRTRFKTLSRDLKKLQGRTPEAGSNEANFLDFLTGKTNIQVFNKVPEGGKVRYRISILPFALSPTGNTPDQRYKAAITAYSFAGLKERTGLTIAACGIEFTVEGNKENELFYPALIKPTYSSAATNLRPAATRSAVTNESYTHERTRTFSIPFGRTTTDVKDAQSGAAETNISDVDELDVLRSLRQELATNQNEANRPLTIGYEPELFKPQVGAKDATAEADIIITGIDTN